MTSTENQELKECTSNESVLNDEITDFMQDNSSDSICESAELMQECISKIESLRMQFRKQHRVMKNFMSTEDYESKYNKSFTQVITAISSYIRLLNQHIQVLHLKKDENLKEMKENKAHFIASDLQRTMKMLNTVCECDVKKLENDKLKERETKLPSDSKLMNNLSAKFTDYIELMPDVKVTRSVRFTYFLLENL